MNGYIAFYNGKRAEVHAPHSLGARNEASAHFRVPLNRVHLITVVLAVKNGVPVTHLPIG